MSKEREIRFGSGQSCALELESSAAAPARDPELTVSRHAVNGLNRGQLSILVFRTQAPAIVRVEADEHDTGLAPDAIEEIRSAAERAVRAQAE